MISRLLSFILYLIVLWVNTAFASSIPLSSGGYVYDAHPNFVLQAVVDESHLLYGHGSEFSPGSISQKTSEYKTDAAGGHFFALLPDFVVTKGVTKSLAKVNPNKLRHLFGQEKHKLGSLLEKFGGNQEKAFRALDDVAQQALKDGKLNLKNGINTQTRVNVNGVEVDLIGGRVVNGRFEIGSASRRDI